MLRPIGCIIALFALTSCVWGQMTVKNSNANITPPGEPDMAK